MASEGRLPDGLISYGPDANCTLTTCPVEASVFQYRPSLAANVTFLVLFGVLLIAHTWRGIRWREWSFTICVATGCIAEILGYGARLMLWQNPFSFTGFIMQICLITFAPVFFCAAIYVQLSRTVIHLDPSLSRFPPALWIWLFLGCDLVSLVLQAAGGALSSTSSGSSSAGVDVALAGLSFQVITLFVFCVACGDYAVRWLRSSGRTEVSGKFKVFVTALAASVLLIFVRCAYRIEELREGYSGELISNEELFIALEGAVIVAAVAALFVAQPGPAFKGDRKGGVDDGVEKGMVSSGSDEALPGAHA